MSFFGISRVFNR